MILILRFPEAMLRISTLLCTGSLLAAPFSLGAAESAADLIALTQKLDAVQLAQQRQAEAWAQERAQLDLVRQSLLDEKVRLENDLEVAQNEVANLDKKLSGSSDAASDFASLEQVVLQLEADLHEALDSVITASLLGLHGVTDGQRSGPHSEDADLRAPLERLNTLERTARSITVRQLTGWTAPDARRAATVLCLGGVAAWWHTDDACGVVRQSKGRLWFDQIDDPNVVQHIRHAFAIHSGTGRLRPLALPFSSVNNNDAAGERVQ